MLYPHHPFVPNDPYTPERRREIEAANRTAAQLVEYDWFRALPAEEIERVARAFDDQADDAARPRRNYSPSAWLVDHIRRDATEVREAGARVNG